MYRVWNFINNYSLLLILGAVLALIWANIDADSYHHFVEFVIWDHAPIGHLHDGHRTLTLHYLINDVLMAFFFAIAAKEVWEAVILEEGSLRGKKAATPLFATLGGMLGPIAVYLGLAAFLGSETYSAVANGWAIPTATDIAFSYLVGRIVFGAGHPAVRFLLLLAIADDAAGLIILAIFYPSGELAPEWLLLSLGAAVAVFLLANWLPRRMDAGNQDRPNSTWVRQKLSFWPYLIAACASWYGFQEAGIHPALGLLPEAFGHRVIGNGATGMFVGAAHARNASLSCAGGGGASCAGARVVCPGTDVAAPPLAGDSGWCAAAGICSVFRSSIFRK